MWDGSVAIITGASKGIGAAVARMASDHGARVGLIARSRGDLDQVAEALAGPVAVATADVADRAAVTDAIDALTDELGPADILVNNAGIGSYRSFVEEDDDRFEELLRVNYLGTIWPTRAVLPGMLERRRGHIVNVASIAGRLGAPFESAYAASKFAVVGMSEALAVEVGPLGVQVSLVHPGPVATTFFDTRGVPYQRRFPRPVAPERVAGAVIAAVERRRFEQIIPRWLRVATITRAIAPAVYVRGASREFGDEVAALGRRLDIT